MRISIALCTYNGGRHLAVQLESILLQTLPPMELVICDDGSSDDTVIRVERFAHAAPFPVRFFRNVTNLGSTRNFEQAMQHCVGQAIALCDQDDVWRPDKLARMAAVLEREPAIAGVFSNAQLIDDNGQPVPGDLWQRFGFSPARQRRFDRSTAALQLIRRDTVTGATLLLRSCWLPRLLPIPPAWVHDGWIALLLASMAELRALPLCPMSYRLHAAQQVGAPQVDLQARFSTPGGRGSRLSSRQCQPVATDAVPDGGFGPPSHPSEPRPAPVVLVELRRKVRFVQGRATLLEHSPSRRLWPAFCLLPG